MEPHAVAIYHGDVGAYSQEPPFNPSVAYPEYAFRELSGAPNAAYQYVRGAFHLAGLDRANYGSRTWNPLKDFIKPGDVVLLKPNLLSADHPRFENGWTCVSTHGSVVRAVADYVWKAMGGEGKIVVADGPQPETSFASVCETVGLNAVADFYARHGLARFGLLDLRRTERLICDEVVVSARRLIGDPRGYVTFDLAASSEFAGHGGAGRYYGAEYDAGEVNDHHSGGRHEYELSGTAIACDVFFNLPKLKTHRKVGVTLSLKNLVGVNGNRNFLPHHTDGDPSSGGDQFHEPGFRTASERRLVRAMRKLSQSVPHVGPWIHRRARKVGKHIYGSGETTIRSGNWYGNDTAWRMCLDLNKIVLYGNSDGTLRPGVAANRRRYLSLVDGILGGEGSGPADPDPVESGMVVFGQNPAYVDAVCTHLMGFDIDAVPVIRQSFRCEHFAIADRDWQQVRCISNHESWNRPLGDMTTDDTWHFKPHHGWLGHIEHTRVLPGADVRAVGGRA
jgi:uncharacterized protein (DUF362 family)